MKFTFFEWFFSSFSSYMYLKPLNVNEGKNEAIS